MQFFRLDGLGRIRLDPLNSDVLQIEITASGPLFEVAEQSKHWVPLNEIALLPLGSAEVSSDLHILPPSLQKHRIRAFKTTDVQTLSFGRTTAVETGNGSIGLHETLMKALCYVHDDGIKPLAVPTAELTRFYLAGVSVLIDHLMHFDLEPASVFDRYCDLSRTGYIDGDRKTFRIAPIAGVCDRGSALQIAMLMTDGPLQASVAQLARQIRLGMQRPENELPPLRSAVPLDLRVALADQNDGRIAKLKNYALADRVLSDFRQPSFERLIIELPFDLTKADFVAPPVAAGPRRQAVVDPAPTYTRDRRPSSPTFRMAATQGSFTQTFPFFGSIKISYDAKTRLPPLPRTPSPPQLLPITLASPLPRGGNEPIARVKAVLESASRPVPTRTTADDIRFAEDVDEARLPKLVAIEGKALDDRLARFFSAGVMLAGRDEVDIGNSSLACEKAGYLRVLELQRRCGRWAWSRRYARGRYVLFFPLPLINCVVWAISIERKPREWVSMGLVMSRGAEEQLPFLMRTLAALATRNSRRANDDDRTFPRQDFADVRFDPIIHSAARRQVSTLAATLADRARALAQKDGGYDPDEL